MKLLDITYDAFGLNINDSSIKIIKLEKSGNKFYVASFGSLDLNPGIVQSGIIKDEKALADAIKLSLSRVRGKKIRTKYAILSLPEEESFLQVIQMPKMSGKDLKSAIVFEAENYIPLPIEEVYLDFQQILPMENGLDHIDVLLAATRKKAVDSYIACVKAAGLLPLAAEVESQSISRALIKNEVAESPIILIDIDKSGANFIIFSGRSIRFTYSIPQLDATELVKQIKKHINFYYEHASHEHLSGEEKIEKIILSGAETDVKKIADFLAEKLSIAVEMGDVFSNLALKRKNNKGVDFLAYAGAMGLALDIINIKKQ